MGRTKYWSAFGVLALVAFGSVVAWIAFNPPALPLGLASGNGRIEATEIDIAARAPARIRDIAVNEGDFVEKDTVLARMDTSSLEAQLHEAEADLQASTIGVDTAQALVRQRIAEKTTALAVVAQRTAERDAAQKRFERSQQLARTGASSAETLDNDKARYEGAKAAVSAAEAQAAAADAAIGAAELAVINAGARVSASKASIERIKFDIDDSVLRAPRTGRIQYRAAEVGEVVGAGGVILNMIDLNDVYITFFLATEDAGRMRLGSEARIVLDAYPEYVLPAAVSFVSDVAQFTPKTVETAEERLKLMFRIKARIDPSLLAKYLRDVKTGVPGIAYVRTRPDIPWPPHLDVRLPK